jgi:uncharacterized OB-fold protein
MTTENTQRPFPTPDLDTQPFWDFVAKKELRFQKCSGCGYVRWPIGPLCPQCRAFDFEWALSSGSGTVYSYTIVRRQTHPAFPVPYVIGLIELPEGPRFIARLLAEEDAVRIGLEVRLDWQDDGAGPVLPVFAPAG